MLPSIGKRILVISVSTGAKFPERYGFGDGRRRGNDRRSDRLAVEAAPRSPGRSDSRRAASPGRRLR